MREHFRDGRLKAVIFAVALGLAESWASSAPAYENDTYKTTCRGDDCVRFVCNEAGSQCYLLGYFDRGEEPHPACVGDDAFESTSLMPRRVCDEGVKADNSPHYHYENVFDPDNDYYNPYP